jgi:hypothetical protein
VRVETIWRRGLCERWIGFSEDDGNPPKAKISSGHYNPSVGEDVYPIRADSQRAGTHDRLRFGVRKRFWAGKLHHQLSWTCRPSLSKE